MERRQGGQAVVSIPRYKPNPLWIGMPIVDDKEGKLCEYRDYVKLEAENARIKAELTDCKVEADRLKAEVERLTFDPLTYLDDQGEWMPRHIHLAAVERLQAEVERLDTLCKQLRMVVLYNDEAAVKGVQS